MFSLKTGKFPKDFCGIEKDLFSISQLKYTLRSELRPFQENLPLIV